MATEHDSDLARRNAELSARVEELTHKLAQTEALTQLAAGTVHDLRNVFSVALIAADTLLHTLRMPEERELAQAVYSAAEHGSFLAQDLLSVARNRGAQVTARGDLLPRVHRLIERIAAKQFACTFEVSPAIEELTVELAQLEAVLINLSINARDAMPNGGELHFSVKNLPEDAEVPPGLPCNRYVQFELTDTGEGMPPDVLAHATEAFFTTKEANGGTGLGLSMAHAFAVRSGGALLIDSEVGRGTCVKLVLPRTVRVEPNACNARNDKLRERIRSPALQALLIGWQQCCPAEGLPTPVAVEARLLDLTESSITMSVVPGTREPKALRLLRVGSKLASALQRVGLRELSVEGPVTVGTLEAAYRRALLSRSPSYELASYSVHDDRAPDTFERLILPAASDGRNVSHLIGVVHFSGALARRELEQSDV